MAAYVIRPLSFDLTFIITTQSLIIVFPLKVYEEYLLILKTQPHSAKDASR